MTDKELRILDEMLTNLEIWSTWNKTFANEMIGICSKMRNLLADHKDESQIDIVRCAECKYKQQCHKAVEHTTHKPTSVTIAYRPIDFCSYGEREGE